METLSRILVGIDFDERGSLTEGSTCAARHALRLAEQCKAEVTFIHSTHRSAEDPPTPTGADLAAGRAELGKLCAESDAATSDLDIVDQAPGLAMIHRVLSDSYDMVVVAKRNQSRRDDRKLGSVSMQLVRMCPCPVWVIKPGQEMTHKSIVAATDLSPVGDRATEYGTLIAGLGECDLFVVHAWQLPLELQMSRSRIGEEEFQRGTQAIADSARAHINAIPAVTQLGDRVKVLLANDTPSHAILEVADKLSPDIVVMGTVSRGGIKGLLVGNTAEKLLYKLDSSLLAVKPDDFISPVR